MMNALVAYDDGQYNAAVDLMKPLRYDILRIGGSNAQVYRVYRFTQLSLDYYSTFIIPLVCRTDPIQPFVQTRYNRYRVNRFLEFFYFATVPKQE